MNIVKCLRTAFLQNTTRGCFWNKRSFKFSALFVMISKLIILSKQNGIPRTNPSEENCPPVGVRVWFRVRVSFKVGGAIFHGGNCPRTKQNMWFYKKSKFHFLLIEIEKKAFASKLCHSRDWNSPNEDPHCSIYHIFFLNQSFYSIVEPGWMFVIT